jgi:hypothetical protein
MLTFLFYVPPHLFLHVHYLLDHIFLLCKFVNVSIDFMHLLSDPPVNPHHILSLALPLQLLRDHHNPLFCGALQFLQLPSDLVEPAVVDPGLQPRHLRDDLAHVVCGLDTRLLEGLLYPLHISLVLLDLIDLCLQVADDLGGGQVAPVDHRV